MSSIGAYAIRNSFLENINHHFPQTPPKICSRQRTYSFFTQFPPYFGFYSLQSWWKEKKSCNLFPSIRIYIFAYMAERKEKVSTPNFVPINLTLILSYLLFHLYCVQERCGEETYVYFFSCSTSDTFSKYLT